MRKNTTIRLNELQLSLILTGTDGGGCCGFFQIEVRMTVRDLLGILLMTNWKALKNIEDGVYVETVCEGVSQL